MHNDRGGRHAGSYLESGGDMRFRRFFWFFALWCAGVVGAAMLALPFEILMRLAMR
jgi:hypothetical protein